jgi:hypothetical protein
MTPLDEKGAMTDLRNELKEVGEELQDKTLDDAQRNRAAAKLRRLERRIDKLEVSKQMPDDSKMDPNLKALHNDLRSLQQTVTEYVVGKDPELQKAEPYFEEVLEEYPEIAMITDPQRRIEAVKSIALRKLREDNPGDDSTSDRGEQVSRVYRTGGGAPVQTRSNPGPSAYAKYKTDLAAAKTPLEKKAITDRFLAAHPEG